jgi:hypothetical protein
MTLRVTRDERHGLLSVTVGRDVAVLCEYEVGENTKADSKVARASLRVTEFAGTSRLRCKH